MFFHVGHTQTCLNFIYFPCISYSALSFILDQLPSASTGKYCLNECNQSYCSVYVFASSAQLLYLVAVRWQWIIYSVRHLQCQKRPKISAQGFWGLECKVKERDPKSKVSLLKRKFCLLCYTFSLQKMLIKIILMFHDISHYMELLQGNAFKE